MTKDHATILFAAALFTVSAVAAIGLMTKPAKALTLLEAQQAVAGYFCSGSTCTKAAGTTTERTGAHAGHSPDFNGTQYGFIHSNGTWIPGSSVGSEDSAASCTATANTTVKVLEFHPNAPARDQAWSVTTSTLSARSNCQ